MLDRLVRRKPPGDDPENPTSAFDYRISSTLPTGLLPSTALVTWFFAFCFLLASFFVVRHIERRVQVSSAIFEAQNSKYLLPGFPISDRLLPPGVLPILIPLANRPEYFSQVLSHTFPLSSEKLSS